MITTPSPLISALSRFAVAAVLGAACVAFIAPAEAVSCIDYGETENYELELVEVLADDGAGVSDELQALWADPSARKTLEIQEVHRSYLTPRVRYDRDGSLVFEFKFDAGEAP